MIDSFPIAFCDNYRIPRARLYQVRSGVGYQASKKRSFYGLKIYLMVMEQGQPVELFLTSGSYSDTKALIQYQFDLPTGATVIGDKAYTDDSMEEMMNDAGLSLLPRRKDNAKTPSTSLDTVSTMLLPQSRRDHWEHARTIVAKIDPRCHSQRIRAQSGPIRAGLQPQLPW